MAYHTFISTAEKLQCEVLTGESTDWPKLDDPELERQFLASSDYHGVRALLYHCLKATRSWETWPVPVRDAIKREAHQLIALEVLRKRELRNVLMSLTNQGINSIFMKGTALAYTHYPSPSLRPRSDTDLLISERHMPVLHSTLLQQGYISYPVRGELIGYQASFRKRSGNGLIHDLDIHWRVSNRQIFANTLDYQSALRAAVQIPELHDKALGLASAHALLLACIHRAANLHGNDYAIGKSCYGGDRLIWIYDIHLLASKMTIEELNIFVELCCAAQVSVVCLDALKRAQVSLHTSIPTFVTEALSHPGSKEISARYLTSSRLKALVTDVQALPVWRDKIKLLREYIVPSKSYLFNRYSFSDKTWPPIAYLYHFIQMGQRMLRPKPPGKDKNDLS